ncbi:MAG: hypothetical protein M0R20_02815 [Candidatus Omnitrophica bacterium]|jgi:hypothetical protein|nr:hypothetical protein [Candidatus Omnitrophota bacterium]
MNILVTKNSKIALSFIVFFLTGCSSAITRYNYNLQYSPSKDKTFNRRAPIKKNFVYNNYEVEILGSILAGDTGFSFECGEGYVLDIFQKEAYALGADLINITYERRMDIWSSCYRAKAEFLRFKNRRIAKDLKSDSQYIR